jgi:hypothetical protein
MNSIMRYLALIFIFPFFAIAEDASFSWDRPALYTNGNPMPASDIGGYIIDVSCNGEDRVSFDVTDGSVNTYTVTDRDAGQCFAAIAVYTQEDDDGNVLASVYSEPIFFTLGVNIPAQINNFKFNP